MSRQRHLARQRLVQALYQWQLTGLAISDIEQQFLREQEMKGVEIDYFCELLHQIPAALDEIDNINRPHLDRSVDSLDPIESAILRIGVYELRSRPEIPFRVIINEGVELAKEFGADQSHRYINTILDKAAATLRPLEVQARKGT
ncbi:MAG: transcription antitermination factor NusB [Gammaproteobacteria bacterium]|nr:transcription antitermination factor NusB [Gammaproteobacteria bacterium]